MLITILKHKWLIVTLRPLSWLYTAIVACRNFLYDRGILKTLHFNECKIISIGNISVGGTGKTPAVSTLARSLMESGIRVAILSRGYRRKGNETVLVSDGQNVLASPERSGDEPYLLATNLPGVPVAVESDRIKGARFLIQRFNPRVILLDDGFQHRRLARDIDIVLFDTSIPPHLCTVLPSGIFREGWHSLKRADMIWLTRTDQSECLSFYRDKIQTITSVPIIQTQMAPVFLASRDQPHIPMAQIQQKRVLLFSGIGNPLSFQHLLENASVVVADHIQYPDHHNYTPKDLNLIRERAQTLHVDYIITTEKDFVKLPLFIVEHIPLLYLHIELAMKMSLASLLNV